MRLRQGARDVLESSRLKLTRIVGVGGVHAAIGVFGAGCNGAENYSGDGNMIDHGWSTAGGRYELRLDQLKAQEKLDESYTLAGLVEEEFFFGFDVLGEPGERCQKRLREVRAQLRMEKPDGSVIFEKAAKLGQWVWQGPGEEGSFFAYSRKWGFTPKPTEAYTLEAGWEGVDGCSADVRVRGIGTAGGWK